MQKNAHHQTVNSTLDPPLCALPDHDPNDPAERLTFCMQQLHRLVSDRIMGILQSELQGEDVSFTQMTALYKVRAFAPISLTLLSEHLGVSLPATSQLIQELVRRELMERRENPENRREKLLALSDKGQQFLYIREKAMMGAYSEVFGQVNPEKINRAEEAITALILEAQQLQAQQPTAQTSPHQPTPHQETV
ncbi:hypothetical protein GCM10022631_35990 [Deinococcus rubellus]|uniref:MarR family transcriptional regulator n=1 Tax=Deinococcus rubellus TaxID=1889240 RepID=A0ABY5YK86_9DEIO|nr:MarR family transcriptional regulator [Deinococcus rubellus]UWX65351.1 MarR family transcriptional regulator [Deinococcus rubellus]